MKSLSNLALEEIHPFILFHCRFQVNWWQSFSPSLLSNSPSSKQQRLGKQLQTPSHHHWHWLRQFAHLECTSSKRIKFLITPHHLSAWSSWPCLLKSWWALHTSLSQASPLQGYKTLTTFFESFNHITPGSTLRLIEIIVVKEISKAIVKVSMDRLFTGSQLREKSRRTASNTVPHLTENKFAITKKKNTWSILSPHLRRPQSQEVPAHPGTSHQPPSVTGVSWNQTSLLLQNICQSVKPLHVLYLHNGQVKGIELQCNKANGRPWLIDLRTLRVVYNCTSDSPWFTFSGGILLYSGAGCRGDTCHGNTTCQVRFAFTWSG